MRYMQLTPHVRNQLPTTLGHLMTGPGGMRETLTIIICRARLKRKHYAVDATVSGPLRIFDMTMHLNFRPELQTESNPTCNLKLI